MSKERPTIGTDGRALPVLPPDRDARVWARLVRVLFYTPGFLALLLLKTGEPANFGVTVELLMLASVAAVVGGLFIAAQTARGEDVAARTGTWCGALVLELLSAVPFIAAIPALFHELATSELLHAKAPDAVNIQLGASELLPALAILPFMLYQLAGFGTLHYVVSRTVNWLINLSILGLIVGSYVGYRRGDFAVEKALVGVLVLLMVATVFHGVLKLKRMQAEYFERCPPPEEKHKKGDKKA